MKPDARDKERLEFYFRPGMPLNNRLTWVSGLLMAGFVIQWTFSIFVGWLLILAGCLLAAVRGKSSEPEVLREGSWQTTTIEELEDVLRLGQSIREWRSRTGAFQLGSGAGCLTLLGALVVIALGALLLVALVDRGPSLSVVPGALVQPPFRGGYVFPIWILDALTMLIPVWFAGSLLAWEPPELLRKASYLLHIYQLHNREPELEFLPSMYVSPVQDRAVPTDCRMLVRFKDAPKDFIGIQVQISLNEVQRTRYPYCYSVIIAKKGFDLPRRANLYNHPASRSDRCVAELEAEEDVDVVVVRQRTSGAGYHTTVDEAVTVFESALTLARTIIKAR